MGNPHRIMTVLGKIRSRRSGNEAIATSLNAKSPRSGRIDQGEPVVGALTSDRIPELDALRGLACLTILVYHVKTTIVPFGWAAVDLFFVLSGYLITSILIRHHGAPGLLRSFYARRALRIWPIYYLSILALVVFGPFLPSPTRWDGLLSYLTYTQNTPLYWSGRVPEFSPYLSHFWTLANEEQFYLIWPLLIYWMGPRSVIPLAVALAAASVVARMRGFDSWLLLARADGFALGGLLAALLANRAIVAKRLNAYRRGFALVILFSIAYLAFVVAKGWLPTFGKPPEGAAFSVLAINTVFFGLVGLVAIRAEHPALAWLRRPRLVMLGTISYGLYIYHFIALMLGADLLALVRTRGRSPLTDVALMGVAFLMACASWRWIEKPLLKLKDRFPYDARTVKTVRKPVPTSKVVVGEEGRGGIYEPC